MFINDFYALLGEDADISDVVPVAFVKFAEFDGVIKFFHLGLVGFCPNLPHMEFSIILARVQSPGFFSILVGSS